MENNKVFSRSRVLIISSEFPPGPGGIGSHAYNLAKHLQKFEDIEITVIANTYFTSHKEVKEFDARNSFKIHRVFRSRIIWLTYLKRIFLAGILISKNDKIICSGKFSLWMAGIFQPLFKNKEFIAIAHGSELDLKNKKTMKLTNYSIRKFHKIISVSNYTQMHLPVAAKNQARTVIANGIDLAENLNKNEDDVFLKEKKPLSLLTVGNVTARKGQKNVIRALPEIIKNFPDVHYHIVGLPTNKEALCDFAQELNVIDHITFHGKISRLELFNMYKMCDIFMMLSEHTADGNFEGFGIAVLEANLWKKPAIGSKNSGIADAIDNESTGILVDQENDVEIARAVSKIYQDYDSFSQKAYEWALRHDWKNIAKKYYEVIFNS